MKPRLLDLFCGAGGCAVGYDRAGFEVVGVDIAPQPRYPFEFHRAGVFEAVMGDLVNLEDFDAVHASPPCQAHSTASGKARKAGREYADLIDHTRELLKVKAPHLPYVIENVAGAPLIDPVRLCGSSFGLPLRRHRLFECNFPVMVPPCDHSWQTEAKYWTGWRPNGEHRLSTVVQVYGNGGDQHEWPAAMGIDWMEPRELAEAIPPVFTEHIGSYLMAEVRRRAKVAA